MDSRNSEHYHDPTPAAAIKHMEHRETVENHSAKIDCGVRIVLAGIPPSLNRFAGRANTWEYRELKAQWTALVNAVVGRNRPAQPYDRAVVSITYRFKDRHRRDPDNYCGKLLLDGLTKAGVIADDSFSHISLYVSAEEEPGVERTVIKVMERKEKQNEN